MQVARTAYPLNAFEAAKFMLRTRTTLAPSASARTATRSPQHAVATGDICPSRILLRSSELHRKNAQPSSAEARARAGRVVKSRRPREAHRPIFGTPAPAGKEGSHLHVAKDA